MRYSYSNTLVYNFPWPSPTDEQKAKIEQTAQAIPDARALYLDNCLADLYDELSIPPELWTAHQRYNRLKTTFLPVEIFASNGDDDEVWDSTAVHGSNGQIEKEQENVNIRKGEAMKQRGKRIAAAILAYLILVLLLMISEQKAGGSIHTFGDAVWYSLVTLTTVGYGDLYPITAVGKGIGSIFVLLSLGFLAFVIGAAIALLTGKWLPKFQLWSNRRKQWWIFSERNDASEALAADLLKNHPDSFAVFCGKDGKGKGIHTRLMPKDLLSDRTLAGGERAVFLISEDEQRNRSAAAALESAHVALYCRSEEIDNARHTAFFSAAEACARDYWQHFPAEMAEKDVVLLGCGKFAQAILDQAILANCMTPFHTLNYHMAGNWQAYLRYHHGLDQCFSINGREPGKDALIFGEEELDPEMLSQADRVILCGDDPAENAQRAHRIRRWLVLTGKLHVLTADASVPGVHFGGAPTLFTEATVMKQEQDRAAKAMHETYCKYNGGPGWETLSPFLRASNRAVADHLPMKKRLLSESTQEQRRHNEHDRWMRFHALYNWTYDVRRDGSGVSGYPALWQWFFLCARRQPHCADAIPAGSVPHVWRRERSVQHSRSALVSERYRADGFLDRSFSCILCDRQRHSCHVG